MVVPSSDCGHFFVLHCGADGIAADCILVKNPDEAASSENNDNKAKFSELCSPPFDSDVLSLFQTFLEGEGKKHKGARPVYRRGNPLLALEPTSFFDHVSDDETKQAAILKELMCLVFSAVDTYGIDIAVCAPNKKTFSFVTKLRAEECPFEGGPFWMLTQAQKDRASALADASKACRLAVFIGAGVSTPAGGPGWNQLLDLLSVGLYTDDEKKDFDKLDVLDKPTILEEDIGDEFKQRVADILKTATRFTPAHAMLKTLNCPGVTTNYDTLYEEAAESCGDEILALPWESRKLMKKNDNIHNSLLKLHGCVKHPEAIVLSRQDYIRFPDEKIALRGRLHGIFLTHEVLFCGFSMTDDNVHKIIDDVKKVLYVNKEPPTDGSKLGTILNPIENKMFDRLWDQDFHLQSFGKSWGDRISPAWYLDCFLDALTTAAL